MTHNILLLSIQLACVVVCIGTIVPKTPSFHPECPCPDEKNCKLPKQAISSEPQVYVFSRGGTEIRPWLWRTIDAVIVPPFFQKTDIFEVGTLCVTHSQKKKFGITVDFDISNGTKGSFATNESKGEARAWQMATLVKQTEWHADIVTINLIPYFTNDTASTREDHHFLATILFGMHSALKHVEMLCIVPWKPPCSKLDDSCDFAQLIGDACTYLVLNPDSFLDTMGSKCKASANIPFSKLVYGISEYNAHHIASDRIILGVTWHGYDYSCYSLIDNVCSLEMPKPNDTEGVEICTYDQRKRVSYGDIVNDHAAEYNDHKQNKMYNAPYFNYKVGSENYQVWFEDHDSLQSKYRLVQELGLRGVAILYGDDLSPMKKPYQTFNDVRMWSWLSHEMLLKDAKNPQKHEDLHWANTVAGVAVGCFILGTLLGVIFTCISMQKRIRKPRRAFRGDTDPLGSEYTDDPDL